MISEHLHFLFGQSCPCVTFTSWSTPSFGMLLSKLSNRKTHVCTSSIRMISFFTLQCELFTSCNVSNNASLVPAWIGGVGGEVFNQFNQMWTGLDREMGVPKILKFVRTFFMDDPIFGYDWVTMATLIQSLGENLNVQEIRFQFNIPSAS